MSSGVGCAGALFLKYCEDNNLDPAAQIPKVDVKFKLHRISDFDQKKGCFCATFVLMLDWNDPSIALSDNIKKPDFTLHFWPKVEIIQTTHNCPETPNLEDYPPKYKPSKNNDDGFGFHRATTTVKYRTELFVTPQYSDFPFDSQTLQISCKLMGIRLAGVKGGIRPEVSDPCRWRWEEGHELIREADCLPEFSLVRLVGKAYSSKHGPFPEINLNGKDKEMYEKSKKSLPVQRKDGSSWNPKHFIDQYTIQIIISRNSTSVLWNMCFSLFVIDCLVFSAHGIPINSLEDRLGVNLSLLLTAMAFKWVLSDKLPDVPYLTTMEKYVIMTFMMLFFQGMLFWLEAELSAYRCEKGYIDWVTGEFVDPSEFVVNVTDSTADATEEPRPVWFDVTCANIHVADRFLLGIECLLMVAKNIWFIARVVHRDYLRLSNGTNFINQQLINQDKTAIALAMNWQPARVSGQTAVLVDGGGSKIAPAASVEAPV